MTALLVEKRTPRWSPASVDELCLADIQHKYFNVRSPESLTLLNDGDFMQYPYAHYTLPREYDVYQAVLGHEAQTTTSRPIITDIVSDFVRKWKERRFVRERVEEILDRCCVSDGNGNIKWLP